MGTAIVCFVIGLLIGWNVFPQPLWVKAIWEKVAAKFKNTQ
jgi:hypothetical protein